MQQEQVYVADRMWLTARGYRPVGFTIFEFQKEINVHGAIHTVKAMCGEPVKIVIERELSLFPRK